MKALPLRFVLLAAIAAASASAQPYGGAAPGSVPDPHAPLDEPMGGFTAAGNPVPKRGVNDFPAESRDVYGQMDQTPGPGGKLIPLDLNPDQIKGRNTWLMWCAGNETFWSWLQQYGYGFTDFLKLVDSRKRPTRFRTTGLINQPGMGPREGRGPWGLYLDEVKTPLPGTNGVDYQGNAYPVYKDPNGVELKSDGANPAVYGYPSGIVGIRLFPNPDFTPEAQKRWDADRYYNDKDPSYYLDPQLVRPLRVGMSCGVCHVGPHPLIPAADPENPAWENLSSNIGSQYLKTQEVFGNLLRPGNTIYHYLRSQQPGTIDTSLTANDNINNANTMNAVWDIPARLAHAKLTPAERQSAANLLLPSIEDGAASINPRRTPRVLLDGSDSIGAFGALARVYLNIGTYYEEWNRVQNPIIGFRPQRPFSIATCRANSIFWQVNEKYRVPYLAAFFTHPRSTAPMKLRDVALYGAEPHKAAAAQALASGAALVARGRAVFVDNCMVCHSSKQPAGFARSYVAQVETPWDRAPVQEGALTLPNDYAQWETFKKSPSYRHYVDQARALAGPAPAADADDAFLKDNFMSIDTRVPVTLVGTSSARALATNGIAGHVWGDFTSDDYKALPAVGKIRFHNPYKSPAAGADDYGNNDEFTAPAGGVGYYRPASLISLWATAPYLHNNSLGSFTGDTSVAGRLALFEEGIHKLLWNKLRSKSPSGIVMKDAQTGAINPEAWRAADGTAGWIYRTTEESYLGFPAKFIRPLVTAVAGDAVVLGLEIAIFVLALLLIFAGFLTGRVLPAHLPGVILILLGGAVAFLLYGEGLGAIMSVPAWLLPALLFVLGAAALFWLRSVQVARIIHFTTGVVLIAGGILLHAFLGGRLGDLRVGPIPRGVPISLLLNLNPDADSAVRFDALAATFQGTRAAAKEKDPDAARAAFEQIAGAALVRASKCPDYVLDRGHWFGEALTDDDKNALIAFLRTL